MNAMIGNTVKYRRYLNNNKGLKHNTVVSDLYCICQIIQLVDLRCQVHAK